MARLPRYFVKGVPLHIILRGNNREPIFGSDEDRQFFKQALLEAVKRHGMPVHAYVLMTNHIHLLASPSTSESVPKVMQSVGRRYVQYLISAISALARYGKAVIARRSSMPRIICSNACAISN